MQLEAVFLCSCQNGICNDFYDIIVWSDDRALIPPGNSTAIMKYLLLVFN